MREPGRKGDGAGDLSQWRHVEPFPSNPSRGRGRLVVGFTAALSILLVTILLATKPGGQGEPATAPPAATGGTDDTFPPGADEPSTPATAQPTDSAGPLPSAPPTAPVPPVPAQARPTRPSPSTPQTRLVAGESCPQTAISGYYRRGWYTDWYARASGGWTADGCAGRVVSVPMSGDRNVDDPDNVVVWWFRVPVGRSCAITVYVPGTGHVLDAAGAPATYLVYAAANATGTPIAEFTVDQVRNQGRWVDAGTFRPPGDQLAVRLATRGIDWGPGRDGAHLGVSALQARC
jgi:hypothetical protein